MVAAASPAGLMKPVNLAAQLAAAETELACLKMARSGQRGPRRTPAGAGRLAQGGHEALAEKLIAAKLREADERHVAPPERRPRWRRLAGG